MSLNQQAKLTVGVLKLNCRENFDPLGVHTGDSIVIAPSQTLSDEVKRSRPSFSLAVD